MLKRERLESERRLSHNITLIFLGTSNQTRIGNTVLVKLPNGQTKPITRLPKRPFELMRVSKNATPPPVGASKPNRSLLAGKKGGADLTPSVSIAPVSKKLIPPTPQRNSDSDSESEDRKPILSPPSQKPKCK